MSLSSLASLASLVYLLVARVLVVSRQSPRVGIGEVEGCCGGLSAKVSLYALLPYAPSSPDRSDFGRRFGRPRLWSGDNSFVGISLPTHTSDFGRVGVTDHITLTA